MEDERGMNDGGEEVCFFFQAEDGIRDAQESRGLGDVYKRQLLLFPLVWTLTETVVILIAKFI